MSDFNKSYRIRTEVGKDTADEYGGEDVSDARENGAEAIHVDNAVGSHEDHGQRAEKEPALLQRGAGFLWRLDFGPGGFVVGFRHGVGTSETIMLMYEINTAATGHGPAADVFSCGSAEFSGENGGQNPSSNPFRRACALLLFRFNTQITYMFTL